MNKIFHIGSTFKAFEEDDDIFIRGMASTADTDRVGDVIEAAAWTKGGLQNYLNNPVILFNHDYNQPIGRAVELSTGDNGLQLKAKIAKSAGHVRELIKEGVLGAFSVGFRVKDAEYLKESDGYKIKDAELLEVSVVTVPANQAATFSLAKSFNSESEYEEFKKTLKDSFPANESVDFQEVKAQEKTMSDIDINAIVAAAVEKTATAMAMKDAEKKAEEARKQKALEEEAARKAADEARIITAVQSGTERLMQEVEKRLADKDADYSRVVNELQSELREKADEIQKIRDSKRVFSNRADEKAFDLEAAKDAYVLGVITRKGLDTKIGRQFIEKAANSDVGVSVPSGAGTVGDVFQMQVSTSIEQDIQLELVLDPLFRKITMNAATMVVPTLPDAGYAEFLTATPPSGSGNGSFPKGNLEARGDTFGSPYSGMSMSQKTLQTYKMVSKSYIANEVEEDAIIPVLPYIRDAMVRAHARGIEQSILLGGVSGAIYGSGVAYKGLVQLATDDGGVRVQDWGTGSPGSPNTATAARLLDMRQAMGKYGRNPNDLVFIVSLDAYYDLLDDAEYDDVNLVGQGLANKVTGQVGSIYATPVIVCDEFASRTNGAAAAVAVNVRNFVIPVLRGVTVEQDYDVENQRRVLVATQRRGFDRMFATAGQVVVANW
jgi:HK97 family phage prohead protease